jgi:hypothetical protein
MMVLVLMLSIAASMQVSMNPGMAQSIGLGLQAVPSITASQEFQRRLADLYNGLQSAYLFNSMANLELQSLAVQDSSYINQDQLKAAGYSIETLTEAAQKLEPYASDTALVQKLENAAAQAKFAALKHLQMQITFAASDVDKAYWNNQLIASAIPQELVVFKVYANYLSVHALGLSIEVHDAFTHEAFLDDVNDRNNDIAQTQEIFAEQVLFNKWAALAQLKLQLHVLYTYEAVTAQNLLAQLGGSSVPSAAVLLEEELKMEPSTNFTSFNIPSSVNTNGNFNPSTSLNNMGNSINTANPSSSSISGPDAQMYNFAQLASKVLRAGAFYAELQVANIGQAGATLVAAGHKILNDGDDSNDEDGASLTERGEKLQATLPLAIIQWTNVQYAKFIVDYFLLYLDLSTPANAAIRIAARSPEAILNTNFVQMPSA